MKQALSDNYDICVENMNDINEKVGNFEVKKATFFNKGNKKETKNVLTFENQQIFSMKDGTFVLEVEVDNDEGGYCEYFYSDNIKDLLGE